MTIELFLQQLATSSQQLLAALEPLSDEQAATHYLENKWSVLECAEHIYLTEMLVMSVLLNALEQPIADTSANKKLPTEEIQGILANRTKSYPAPKFVEPQGMVTSLEDFRQKFAESRKNLAEAVQNGTLNIHSEQMVKHPMMGFMSVPNWLVFLISHSNRHLQQIEETKYRLSA